MSSDSGYTLEQLQKLEKFFVECKFPNRELREKWSRDLGMDPDNIKYWFKNKILLLQIEEKRQENNALRSENVLLQWENIVMSKKLENFPKCTCSRNEALEAILRENAKLKEEHQRVANLLVGILQYHTWPQPRDRQAGISPNDDEIQGLDADHELGSAPTSNDKFDDK